MAKEILFYHDKTLGLVFFFTIKIIKSMYIFLKLIGGTNRKAESSKLKIGINLIIATPGRLLDHL